jgi:UDP:flavonoid glycosyltransferase YjiC (YdhE family)
MPYVTAYVTNGGYGGTMLGIMNKLPMVVAGVHEGKNEICARVGYFKLGINLRTERPTPRQVQDAVNRIIMDDEYRTNVKELAAEFARFNPCERSARYIAGLAKKGGAKEPKKHLHHH